ncbi:MAG: EboA domain-containing protein, partial [Trebonia sp.]
DPRALPRRFAAAGRGCGRGSLEAADPRLNGWSVDDAARFALIDALRLPAGRLAEELSALYAHGDSSERRAILRALEFTEAGDQFLPLVSDALRCNEAQLIGVAMGPYAARYLGQPAWRHGVLKCVFLSLPLAVVAGLDHRADAEVARMLAAFAHERIAAGRDVPADIWPVVERFPGVLRECGLLDELGSTVPARAAAAHRALDRRLSGLQEDRDADI